MVFYYWHRSSSIIHLFVLCLLPGDFLKNHLRVLLSFSCLNFFKFQNFIFVLQHFPLKNSILFHVMNAVSLRILIFPKFLPTLSQWFQYCLFLACFGLCFLLDVSLRFLVTSGCLLMFKSGGWANGVSEPRVGCWEWPSVWADLAGPLYWGIPEAGQSSWSVLFPPPVWGWRWGFQCLGAEKGKRAETAHVPCVHDHLAPWFSNSTSEPMYSGAL